MSDADGIYTFRYVRDGEYVMNVFKDGYFEKEVPVHVVNGQAVTQDVTIEELNAYPVSGRVVSADNQPLADVTVLLKEGEHEYTAQTAADGTFGWNLVLSSANPYSLTLTKEWYKSLEQEVTVAADAVTLGDIKVDYLVYAPSAVRVVAEGTDGAKVSWQTADVKSELRKDDGKLSANWV